MAFKARGASRPGPALPRPFGRFVGFACIQAWFGCACVAGLFPSAGLTMSVLSSLALQVCGGVAVSSAVVLLLTLRLVPLSRKRGLCVAAAIGCALFSFVMVQSLNTVDLQSLAEPAAFLAGVCAGVQVLAWQEYFSTLGVRAAVSGLVAASAIGTALYLACEALPYFLGSLCFALLPLVGEAARLPAPGTRFFSSASGSIDMRRLLGNMLHDYSPRMYLLCMLVCMAFACGCTAVAPSSETFWRAGWAVFACVAGLAMCVACLGVLFSPAPLLMRLFYVSLPLLMLDAVLVVPGGSLAGLLALVAGGAGVSLAYCIVWSLMVSSAADKRLPTLGLIAFLHVSCFAGAVLGLAVVRAVELDSVQCCIAMLVCLSVASLLFASFNGKVKVTEEAYAAVAEAKHAQGIVELAKRCGLTARELEVLQAWASGHNAAYVEQTLGISRNTVKTHLNHIYAKVGVSGREELLVLLETQGSVSSKNNKT